MDASHDLKLLYIRTLIGRLTADDEKLMDHIERLLTECKAQEARDA